MFEEDRSLMPKDILVMMPDIESYAPYIQAVFDASPEDPKRIPFSIVSDRNIRKKKEVWSRVFWPILDLKEAASEVPGSWTFSSAKRFDASTGFSEDDLDQIRTLDFRDPHPLGNRRPAQGGDGGCPPSLTNTWRAGIERLLLGYAMPGHNEALFEGILPYDAVEGSKAQVLGAFAAFVEKLLGVPSYLARPRTLRGWSRKPSWI